MGVSHEGRRMEILCGEMDGHVGRLGRRHFRPSPPCHVSSLVFSHRSPLITKMTGPETNLGLFPARISEFGNGCSRTHWTRRWITERTLIPSSKRSLRPSWNITHPHGSRPQGSSTSSY